MIRNNLEYHTYLNFNSSKIQKIWKKDQWFLIKVCRIAFSIFSHNVATFFKNQSLWTQSFFASPKKIDPLPSLSQIKPSKAHFLPLIGALAGILGGFSARIIAEIPANHKDNCRLLSQQLFLPTINQIKQWELKNFALFSLLIPLGYNMLTAMRKESPEKPLHQKIKSAATKQFSAKEFLAFSLISLFALTNPLYSQTLGLSTKGGFDSSGHVMLKMALVPMMATVLEKTGKINPRLSLATALTYAVTDAIFLYNTSHLCHTVYETLAGVGWAGTIIALGFGMTSLPWTNKKKVL